MFEVDVRNVNSLSSANYFRYKHCVNISVHCNSFPAPVPSGKATAPLQLEVKKNEVSPSSAQLLYMAGGEIQKEKHFFQADFLGK